MQNNTVSGGTSLAYSLYSGALNPASITGNTSSGDRQNSLDVYGTLAASWAMPYVGLPVVVQDTLVVPEGDLVEHGGRDGPEVREWCAS